MCPNYVFIVKHNKKSFSQKYCKLFYWNIIFNVLNQQVLMHLDDDVLLQYDFYLFTLYSWNRLLNNATFGKQIGVIPIQSHYANVQREKLFLYKLQEAERKVSFIMPKYLWSDIQDSWFPDNWMLHFFYYIKKYLRKMYLMPTVSRGIVMTINILTRYTETSMLRSGHGNGKRS